jgi:tetratricopeptide (TPR) repeat protein
MEEGIMKQVLMRFLICLSLLLVPVILLYGQTAETGLLLSQNRQGILSLVAIGANKAEVGRGTAFAVSEDTVVTNYHLVAQASTVELYTYDNKRIKVDGLLSMNRQTDLALLRARGKFAPLIIGNFDTLEKDKKIIALGANETGDIVAVEGSVKRIIDLGQNQRIADLNVSVPRSFSGGPIMDATGQVFAIITAWDRTFKFGVPVNPIRSMPSQGKPVSFDDLQPDDYLNTEDGAMFAGRSASAIDDWSDAQKYLEKVTKLNPSRTDALALLAKVYSDQRDYNSAINAYKKVIEADPSRAELYFEIGNIYLKTQKFSDAIQSYQKAIQLNITKKEAYLYIGNAYEQQKDFANAAMSYERYLLLLPEDPGPAQFQLGMCYNQLGQYDKAILALEDAVKSKPQEQPYNYQLALTYQKAKEYEKAEQTYRNLIALSPQDALNYYSMIIRMYDEAGMPEKAIGAAQKIIELNPKSEISILNLGIIYYKLKRYDEAIATFRQALAVKPDYEMAQNYIGVSYAQEKKYKEAIEAFREYVRLVPDSADGWFNIGINYMLLKDFRGALEPLRRCVQIKPDYAVAQFNLAVVYLNLGDRGTAGEILTTLNKLDPDLATRLRRIMQR